MTTVELGPTEQTQNKRCCNNVLIEKTKKHKHQLILTQVTRESINPPTLHQPIIPQGLILFKKTAILLPTTCLLHHCLVHFPICKKFYSLLLDKYISLLNYLENNFVFSRVRTIIAPLTSGKMTIKRSFVLEKQGRGVQILSPNGKKKPSTLTDVRLHLRLLCC